MCQSLLIPREGFWGDIAMLIPFCFSTHQGGRLRIRQITVKCGKNEDWGRGEHLRNLERRTTPWAGGPEAGVLTLNTGYRDYSSTGLAFRAPSGPALGESTTAKQKCKHTLGTSPPESSLGDILVSFLWTPWVMENTFHKDHAKHHTLYVRCQLPTSEFPLEGS